METIENNENSKNRRTVVRIIYGIAMAALVVLLLVSLFFYAREWQRIHNANTVTTGGPQSGTIGITQSGNTGSTGEKQDGVTTPTDPVKQTQGETTPPMDPGGETQGNITEQITTPTESIVETRPVATEPSVPPTIDTEPTYPADSVVMELPAHTEAVCLIGKAAKTYLDSEDVGSVSDILAPYWNKGTRLDVGVPVELSYTVLHLPKGVSVKDAVFQISTSNSFKQVREVEAEAGARSVHVYNLLTGIRYYYRVIITLSDGSAHTLQSSFKTAATPRLLNIDGIVNVRDIGGWVTSSGKIVKQGLLYRGSELDGSVEYGFTITEKGKEQMINLLKIRTDMDLRHAGKDILGPKVQHIYYSAIQYEQVFTNAGSDAVRRVFSDLANPDNYPIYMHCTYGADRTGTMCYLLEALLGVSDADLIRDYELTALYYGYVSPELMNAFVQRIAAYPGDTTQERVENFLLSVGVTEQEIASIRQIFLNA